MAKYDALFEDENDIFAGSPVSKYWDISNQLSDDMVRLEFDMLIEKMAVMEDLLAQAHSYEDIDRIVKNHAISNYDKIDEMKKSLYIDLTTQLIYRIPE